MRVTLHFRSERRVRTVIDFDLDLEITLDLAFGV